jgi:hypothetical protein
MACTRGDLVGKIRQDFHLTAVCNIMRCGIVELMAQRILGHKTRRVFDRSSIVNDGDLRGSAQKLLGLGILMGTGWIAALFLKIGKLRQHRRCSTMISFWTGPRICEFR